MAILKKQSPIKRKAKPKFRFTPTGRRPTKKPYIWRPGAGPTSARPVPAPSPDWEESKCKSSHRLPPLGSGYLPRETRGLNKLPPSKNSSLPRNPRIQTKLSNCAPLGRAREFFPPPGNPSPALGFFPDPHPPRHYRRPPLLCPPWVDLIKRPKRRPRRTRPPSLRFPPATDHRRLNLDSWRGPPL